MLQVDRVMLLDYHNRARGGEGGALYTGISCADTIGERVRGPQTGYSHAQLLILVDGGSASWLGGQTAHLFQYARCA